MKKVKIIVLLVKIFLIFFIIFNVASPVYSQKEKYFIGNYWDRFPSLEKSYLDSQYVNKDYIGFVPDEIVFAYAGGEFLRGAHPLLIIPDAPPLGKYIIGLSIYLFNNEHFVIILFAITSLFLLYILGKQIFHSNIFALLPVALYSSETIFKNQLIYTPLFDLFHLTFMLASFIAFNKGLSGKKYHIFFLVANIFLGLFISTKFFASGITIIAAFYLVLLIRRDKKRLISLTLSMPLVPAILLASYSRVFAFGYNLRELIGAQKWIFIYHQSKIINPFSVWPLLLFNQWHVWWGDREILSDPQWHMLWPVITISAFSVAILYSLKKIKSNPCLELPVIWIICYLLFFSIGNITTRYFIILLPMLYLIAVYGIYEVINKKFRLMPKL